MFEIYASKNLAIYCLYCLNMSFKSIYKYNIENKFFDIEILLKMYLLLF